MKSTETFESLAPKQRQTHNYTSELELKSLIIRVQNWNKRKVNGEVPLTKDEQRLNRIINRYIIIHTKMNNSTAAEDQCKIKFNTLKKKIKERVVNLSVQVQIDKASYEAFGAILLLMIKNILKKHQFSGYSYRDDFYSDAIHKTLRYLHNFNHLLISERTGAEVNAFAYISTIIHNSVVFIIKQKAKEQENIKDVISLEISQGDLDLKAVHKKGDFVSAPQTEEQYEYKIKLDDLENISIAESLEKINSEIEAGHYIKDARFCIEYPHNYRISFEEYEALKPFLKGHFSIVRGHK